MRQRARVLPPNAHSARKLRILTAIYSRGGFALAVPEPPLQRDGIQDSYQKVDGDWIAGAVRFHYASLWRQLTAGVAGRKGIAFQGSDVYAGNYYVDHRSVIAGRCCWAFFCDG